MSTANFQLPTLRRDFERLLDLPPLQLWLVVQPIIEGIPNFKPYEFLRLSAGCKCGDNMNLKVASYKEEDALEHPAYLQWCAIADDAGEVCMNVNISDSIPNRGLEGSGGLQWLAVICNLVANGRIRSSSCEKLNRSNIAVWMNHDFDRESIRRQQGWHFHFRNVVRMSVDACHALSNEPNGDAQSQEWESKGVADALPPAEEITEPLLPTVRLTKRQDQLLRAVWAHCDWKRRRSKIRDVVLTVWNDEEKESTALRPQLSKIADACSMCSPPVILTLPIEGDWIIVDYQE